MSQFTRSTHRRVCSAALETVSVYLFVGWAYVSVIAIFQPDTLNLPIWHGVRWLRRDTFGAVAFAGSFVTYLVLQLIGLRRFASKNEGPRVSE